MVKVPTSYYSLDKRRNRFDKALNKAIGEMVESGLTPSLKEICRGVGLQHKLTKHKDKVYASIYKHKKLADIAWDIFEKDPAYMKRYKEHSKDFIAFDAWKKKNAGLYTNLTKRYGLNEEQIHDFWVQYRMWEEFIKAGRSFHFYFFVSNKHHKYIQPDFWQYTELQIRRAMMLGKGIQTLMIRHHTMKMMLTSGESPDTIYKLQDDVIKMIGDGKPSRFRCEVCNEAGILKQFKTQTDLVEHYMRNHGSEVETDEEKSRKMFDKYYGEGLGKYTDEEEKTFEGQKNDKGVD